MLQLDEATLRVLSGAHDITSVRKQPTLLSLILKLNMLHNFNHVHINQTNSKLYIFHVDINPQSKAKL